MKNRTRSKKGKKKRSRSLCPTCMRPLEEHPGGVFFTRCELVPIAFLRVEEDGGAIKDIAYIPDKLMQRTHGNRYALVHTNNLPPEVKELMKNA